MKSDQVAGGPPQRYPAAEAPRRPATTHQEAVAGQKQTGWDEPEETLQAPRTVEVYLETQMRPAVRCSWGRCSARFPPT
jgi:hypothetical protein